MRYAAICKALNALPRSGGVLDQPAPEILRLERMLDVYAKYEERRNRHEQNSAKNRQRHEPTTIKEVQG